MFLIYGFLSFICSEIFSAVTFSYILYSETNNSSISNLQSPKSVVYCKFLIAHILLIFNWKNPVNLNVLDFLSLGFYLILPRIRSTH